MTNRIALILGVLIALGLTLDLTMGWGVSLFLARKLLLLMDWVTFWR